MSKPLRVYIVLPFVVYIAFFLISEKPWMQKTNQVPKVIYTMIDKPKMELYVNVKIVDKKEIIKNKKITTLQGAERRKISVEESKRIVLENVCREGGITEKNCWKTLYAMHLTETRGDCKAVGDSGKSRGCFQIQTKLHKVSVACAQDIKCSGKWTLEHLKAHGYPKHVSHAVKRHNGSGEATKYYLATVNEFKNKIQ